MTEELSRGQGSGDADGVAYTSESGPGGMCRSDTSEIVATSPWNASW
jgi:hypothetical protein